MNYTSELSGIAQDRAPSADSQAARTLFDYDAGPGSVRLALIIVAISLGMFITLIPIASTPLAPAPWFIPLHQPVLAINDLITTTLLLGYFKLTRKHSVLVLACGYLYSAVMATVHLLSFPGVFTPGGLLGAGSQSTGYLHVFWHLGFPVSVIAYAFLKESDRHAGRPGRATTKAVLATLACAALLATLATAGSDWLPQMLVDNRYSSVFNIGRYGQWFVTGLALAILFTRRSTSTMDTWLIVVLAAWFFEIGLVSVFNAGRWDVGFYAGRAYGLVASSFVLIMLLVEHGRMHRDLAEAQATARTAARLQETQQVLGLALEAGRMGVFSWDLVGKRAWWSPEVEHDILRPAARGTGPGAGRADALRVRRGPRAPARADPRLHRQPARMRRRVPPVRRPGTGPLGLRARKGRLRRARQGDRGLRRHRRHQAAQAWRGRGGRDGAAFPHDGRRIAGDRMDGAAGRLDLLVQPALARVYRAVAERGRRLGLAQGERSGAGAGDRRPVAAFGRHRRAVRDGDPAAGHGRPLAPVPEPGRGAAQQRRPDRPLVRGQCRHHRPDRGGAGAQAGGPAQGRIPGDPRPRAAQSAGADPQRRRPALAHVRPAGQRRTGAGRHRPPVAPPCPAGRRLAGGVAYHPGQDRPAQGGRVAARLPVRCAARGGRRAQGRRARGAGAPARRPPVCPCGLHPHGPVLPQPAEQRDQVHAPRRRDRRVGRAPPGQAKITISDSGIGIPREHLQDIFGLFSQVTPALERSQGGLGIGLSLVKGFVELHGGSVEAASEGAGSGSTFTVYLPLLEQPALAPADAPRTSHGAKREAGPEPRRVLVIDDNRDAATSMVALLQAAGHQVREAHDGQEGLRLAFEFEPEVVLLDLGMPGLSGFDVGRELRGRTAQAAPRIIAVTGWGQESDRRLTSEAGFDFHLTKPVNHTELDMLLSMDAPGPEQAAPLRH